MGSGSWFRSIIGLKKVKEYKSKQVKVHSGTEKSDEANGSYDTHKQSNIIANVGSNGNPGVPEMSEDIAATRIQNAFRAFMARKALRRRKGAVRFNVLIQDHTAQKQTSTTLNYIHSWSNIQAQIRARRLCMVTEGRLRQKKLENQLKLEAKIHELEVEWCGSSETMEEILSKIQQREEAAIKRERAMAYAFSHQWRANSSQYLGQASYSLGKENWGWSWTERWIAARPWEVRVVHAQPTNLKKVQTRSSSKLDNKLANQPDVKVSISVKPALSNGNGKETTTTKAKKLAQPDC